MPSSKEFFIATVFLLSSLHFLFCGGGSAPRRIWKIRFSVFFCWIFRNFIASQIFGDALRVWVFQALFHPSQKFVVRNLDVLSVGCSQAIFLNFSEDRFCKMEIASVMLNVRIIRLQSADNSSLVISYKALNFVDNSESSHFSKDCAEKFSINESAFSAQKPKH